MGIAYAACGAAAAGITRRSIAKHRPSSPTGWRLVEVGLWFVAFYGLSMSVGAWLPGVAWPAQLAGALDLVTNAAVLGAALHFLRVRRPGQDREPSSMPARWCSPGACWSSSSVSATASSPRSCSHASSWLAALLLLAAGLVVGLRLCFTEHWPRSFLPLLAGAALGVVGNLGMLAQGSPDFAPRWVQSVWLGSGALAAIAAALPDMRLLGEPEAVRGEGHVSPYRLLGLSAALLTSPVLVLLADERSWQGCVVAGGLSVLTGLVIWRIARLLSERERMRHSLLREVAEREALQAQLVHQATHDGLTGLPTRGLFHDRLQQALAAPGGSYAVLCVDLDGFKAVNDTFGHLAGDELLRVFGARLRSALRTGDLAARLGGDEFAVLVDLRGDAGAEVEVAERILAALRQPIAVRGTTVTMAASVGIAAYAGGGPQVGRSPDATTLLERADATMYDAKSRGKGQYRVWSAPVSAASKASVKTVGHGSIQPPRPRIGERADHDAERGVAAR